MVVCQSHIGLVGCYNQHWTGIVPFRCFSRCCCFCNHTGIYNKYFTFLILLGYEYLMVFLFFNLIRVYISIQESSYLGKIAIVSIWFRMVLTQMTTRVCKDSLTLTYQLGNNI